MNPKCAEGGIVQAGDAGSIDANEIVDLQREYLFPCVATSYQEPLVAVHGRGM